MKTIDLTHLISATMPVYPGTEPPVITEKTTIEKEGFAEKQISFFSHTGTHIDAPGHILQGRLTLDQFSAEKFVGNGFVIDVTKSAAKIITKESIEKFSAEIAACDFVLFNTGWDRRWGRESYFADFPTLSGEASKWLCNFELKGIGFDCISADPVEATNFGNHKILLNNDFIIIENLCNLQKLNGKKFLFSCLPLKIENSDGSPVRAVGVLYI